MAIAIPVETQAKLLRLGAAFGTGAVAALAERQNPAAANLVVFGGGVIGLLGALTMRGTIAEVGEGIANASAASLGNITVTRFMKGTRSLVGHGGPKLLAGGRVNELIPRRETAPLGGYRPL